MNILVVGAGEVGRFLSQTLSMAGHDVLVVEHAESVARELNENEDVRVIQGNGASAEVLTRAGIHGQDYCLAMTSDDRVNIIACSLAKKLGARHTIARIHDQTYSDNSLVNYQSHFGIDFLLNPEALCAVELAKAIRNPGRVEVENFARGKIEVQPMRVVRKSRFTGRPLKDVRLPPQVRIGFVQHAGEKKAEVPTAETEIEVGDVLTMVGPPEALFELRGEFENRARAETIRVVIFGGSETAIALIRLLKNPRFKIRVIEGDKRTCHKLAERFPHITVIHGSATSLRLLEEEQIGSADYFVACTRDDEENIMTCLQARKLGAQHVQLVFNKPDYEEVLDELKESLGVELAVAPRKATVAEIMRYLSPDPHTELAVLPNGTGRILEVRVSADSPCIEKPLREIALPKGTVIVALMHKFQAKVPGADDVILAGDRLVVMVREESLGAMLKLLT